MSDHIHARTANCRRFDNATVIVPKAESILGALHDASSALNALVWSFDLDLSAVSIHLQDVARADLHALGSTGAPRFHQIDERRVVKPIDVAPVPGRGPGEIDGKHAGRNDCDAGSQPQMSRGCRSKGSKNTRAYPETDCSEGAKSEPSFWTRDDEPRQCGEDPSDDPKTERAKGSTRGRIRIR